MPHKFKAENWERLLSDQRRAILDPDAFVSGIGIASGESVADLGAGPGFFTAPLAQRVGPSGCVYALDIAPEMVAVLRDQGLPSHVQVLQSGESKLPLTNSSVDTALLAFVLHELESPEEFLSETHRVLRGGGRLVVLDWVPRIEEMGPPLRERIAPPAAEQLIARAGFDITESAFVNTSHYHIVARRTTRGGESTI